MDKNLLAKNKPRYVHYVVTYKRVGRLHTPFALMKSGVPKEDIIISVQSEEELEEYREFYKDEGFTFELNQARSAATHKNAIIRKLKIGEQVMVYDDDIRRFREWWDKPGTKHGSGRLVKDLNEVCYKAFQVAELEGAEYWDLSPQYNSMFIKGRLKNGPYQKWIYLCASTLGVTYQGNLLDETLTMLDDTELTFRLLNSGGMVFRYSGVATDAAPVGKNPGGMTGQRTLEENQKIDKILLEKYPDITHINYKGWLRLLPWNRVDSEVKAKLEKLQKKNKPSFVVKGPYGRDMSS